MKKFILSLGFGFIINNLVATVIAIFILNPLLNTMFGNSIRSQEEGLEMPSLLCGYFLLTLLMVIGYKHFIFKANWLKKGIAWGLLVGGFTYVSAHLIVASWAKIPPMAMFITGLLDTLATVSTGIVIAYIYRND